MKIFQNVLSGSDQYSSLLNKITTHQCPVSVYGLSHIHKALMISCIASQSQRDCLVIAADESDGRKLCDDINAFYGYGISAFYPSRDFILTHIESVSKEFENERLMVLGKIISKQIKIVVACGDGVIQRTMPKNIFMQNMFNVNLGEDFPQEKLVQGLLSCGYVPRSQVDGICQFSVRGGIVDCFPPHNSDPIRFEFWGDTVDSVSEFDIISQRRTSSLENVTIPPAREVILSNEKLSDIISSLMGSAKGAKKQLILESLERDREQLNSGIELTTLDKYLPLAYPLCCLCDYFDDPVIFLSDYTAISQRIKDYSWQQNEDIKALLETGGLTKQISEFSLPSELFFDYIKKSDTVMIDTFAKGFTLLPVKASYNFNLNTVAVWSGMLSALTEDLSYYKEKKYCILIAVKNEKSAQNLRNDLEKEGFDCLVTDKLNSILLGKILITVGTFSSGFEIPQCRFALLTQGTVQRGSSRRLKVKKSEQFGSLEDLSVGDYVVHASHGVGIFDGITKLDVQGISKDYIKIRYKGSDILFVPVTQLDLVARYLGNKNDTSVRLNKLNSGEWEKAKTRVKSSVKEMAKELIALYAQRMTATGYSFPEDDFLQQEFDEHFEYEETEDQLECISDIKEDMKKPRPMERLLCGDVGFGKTEVALRGAFKCVSDGKQCVLLVPTTILAWQHYQTALRRFEGFPVNIEILSRYRKPKQQEQIIKKLRTGEIDFIIGTHRLVQKDIVFKDLGLAIIDEEQRFGVAQKEKFKSMFKGVDLLTLSATPIPRTLNMAMSGIRDMSVIDQPPIDRHPVQSYVLEYSPTIVADAIKKELRRGGQVFYLFNNVQKIQECADKIRSLVPEAVVDIGHGKMPEEELTNVWGRLINKETDVLVCTTIIETGVDVSNCNTLIVENADNFGLSQLYQLRGRVGRSSRRAFAYFTFTRGKILTEIATKRLEAIKEFTNFGSGFKIAMRDLQIRGAGNILGAQQHGQMESVGYDMYVRLLSQAISEEKGEPVSTKNQECLIDIRIGAHIPESYISNLAQRIEVYKKIAAIKSNEDVLDVTDELIDRFGEPDQSVKGLIDVSLLRNMASEIGIYEIKQKQNCIDFHMTAINIEKASCLANALKGKVMVGAADKPYITVKTDSKIPIIEQIRRVLIQLL